jgi:hypothetical protein
MSWQECAFGDAPCSTAAGTWALTLVGGLGFLAAALTVAYARRALGIELEATLGQSPCSHHEEKDHPADKEVFVTTRGQTLRKIPFGLSRSDLLEYFSTPIHVAFVNLGRTALASVSATMWLESERTKARISYPLYIGNIKCDQEIHVAVYVSRRHAPFKITWHAATERGNKIKFYAEDPVTTSVVVPLSEGDVLLPMGPQRPPNPPPTTMTTE